MIQPVYKHHAAKRTRTLLLSFFFITIVAGMCRAQSEIQTPYTGKVSCQQILQLKPEGVVSLYERKFQAERKWALADYNRCQSGANAAAAKSLTPAAQSDIRQLREIVETYFNSIYSMRANEVGGGEPFELEEVAAQTEVEELIGKAIKIYSKPNRARTDLRARATEHLARVESRLPEMTAPLKPSDLDWLDTSTEEGREAAQRLQQDHAEAAANLRESVKRLRSLINTLPDALALHTAELIDGDK
jgi:hypothetical protein